MTRRNTVRVYNHQLQEAVAIAEANETRALQQHELADARHRLARDSMRQMLNRLDAERRADVPRLMELRLALLKDSQGFFETVLQQADNPDPSLRTDVSFVVAATGSTQSALGKAGPAHSARR
jgi:hypothetical protein